MFSKRLNENDSLYIDVYACVGVGAFVVPNYVLHVFTLQLCIVLVAIVVCRLL